MPDFVAVVRAEASRKKERQNNLKCRSFNNVAKRPARAFVVHRFPPTVRVAPSLPPRPYVWVMAAERKAKQAADRAAYKAGIIRCCDELRASATTLSDTEETHRQLVHQLAAKVARGQKVSPRVIEAAVQRKFGVDMMGQLSQLQGPLLKSYSICEATRERLQSPAFAELLTLPEQRNDEACQLSDVFVNVYEQAEKAQALLKSKVASSWKADPSEPSREVPVPMSTATWIDGAVSPGIKGKLRAEEQMRDECADHANKLTDLARITLTYADCGRMMRAIRRDMGTNGINIIQLENRYLYPTALGYSDVNTTVDVILPSQKFKFLCEVRLNHPEMIRAEEEARQYHEIIRKALPTLCQSIAIDASVRDYFLGQVLAQLNRSSLEFATEELMAKTGSISDVLGAAAVLESMVKQGQSISLDDLVALPVAPIKHAQDAEVAAEMERARQEVAAARAKQEAEAARVEAEEKARQEAVQARRREVEEAARRKAEEKARREAMATVKTWKVGAHKVRIADGYAELPDGCLKVPQDGFRGCSYVTSIEMPASVITIGDHAFAYCSSLTSIDLPSSVTTIGDGAFAHCSSLSSLTIPSSVITIGDSAFVSCDALVSVAIPSSVITIGDGAFTGCSALTSVAIPAAVTKIGDGAFEGCSSMTSAIIPPSVTTIGDGAFAGCTSLASVAIPSSVTKIGSDVFHPSTLVTGEGLEELGLTVRECPRDGDEEVQLSRAGQAPSLGEEQQLV